MAKRTYRGAAPGAPKPKIEAPRTPVLARRGVRLGALAVLIAGILWLVLALLGNAHRAGALDKYDRDLARAMRPYTQHQSETVPDSFLNIPQRFSDGSVATARLTEAATKWKGDFESAATNVRGLTPPAQLEAAQEMIANALDQYATLAEEYQALASTKRAADLARGRDKTRLDGLVTAWTARISAGRADAAALLAAGQRRVAELKAEWGVGPAAEADPAPAGTLPIPDGLPLPDGGLGG